MAMAVPKIFQGIPASYMIAAVIFGIFVAFGFASISYHPQPVQVPINQYAPLERYTPAPPPPPEVPTVPVPTGTGKFDPAPAPVVITTEPTIAPVPVPAKTDFSISCLTMNKSMQDTKGVAQILIGSLLALSVIGLLLAFFSGQGFIEAIVILLVAAMMLMIVPSVLDAMMYSMMC